MSALTGLAVDVIQAARLETAEKFAAEWKCVVVLKGAFTLIAAPDGRTTVVPVATPALARAGTGDVLAGTITGLMAQGLLPYDAARLGAWLHAQAGLAAARRLGTAAAVLAGDLVEELARAQPEFDTRRQKELAHGRKDERF
jgi:NAD(P)H-hydrate epimerase